MSISFVRYSARGVVISEDHLSALHALLQLLADWLNEPTRSPVKRFQSLRLRWKIEAVVPAEAQDTAFFLESLLPGEDLCFWVRPTTQEAIRFFKIRLVGSKRLKTRDRLHELLEELFETGVVSDTGRNVMRPPPPSERALIEGSTIVPHIPTPRLPAGVERDPESLARILYTHFAGNGFSEKDLGRGVVRAAGVSSRATLVERLRGPCLAPYIEHTTDEDASRFAWKSTSHNTLFPEAASPATKTTAGPKPRPSSS